MRNKKAAAEGITWTIGLIAILMIVFFAIIAYRLGNIGEKQPLTFDSLSSSSFASELQRVGAYVISSDFNSSSKGKILNDIYHNVKEERISSENYMVTGLSNVNAVKTNYLSFPILPLSDFYSLQNSITYGVSVSGNSFYLPCSKCLDKYLLFGLVRRDNAK